MGIQKCRLSAHEIDIVKRQVFQDTPALHVHNFALVMHKVVNGEIFLERVVDSVKAALLQAGEIECRFAKRLAGNRAGVDAASSHVLGAFDDGHAFAEVRSLRTGFFAGRTAANHDQIEIVARKHESSRESVTAKPAKYIAVGCLATRCLYMRIRRAALPLQRFLYSASSTALPYSARKKAWEAAGGVCRRRGRRGREGGRRVHGGSGSACGRASEESPRRGARLSTSCIPDSRKPGCGRSCAWTGPAARRDRCSAFARSSAAGNNSSGRPRAGGWPGAPPSIRTNPYFRG